MPLVVHPIGAYVTPSDPNARAAYFRSERVIVGAFMKLVRPGIAVVTVALALAIPLGTGAAATSSGVQSTGSAHGIVLDAAGNPQAHVCVGAYPLDEQGVAHGYTQSAADGSYTLAALDPGTYNVKIDGCFGGLSGPDIQQEYYLATSPNGTQTNGYTTLTIVSWGEPLASDSADPTGRRYRNQDRGFGRSGRYRNLSGRCAGRAWYQRLRVRKHACAGRQRLYPDY